MAKIKEVRCIRTRQNGTWVIVKIITDQPGLYGIGSASEHNHAATVATALEESLGPLLIGREASRIEDIWQCVYNSGYWRSGSILNAALGGIDMALWDIKGKEAGMPVYELLGGACRAAVPCYAHAGGGDHEALADDIQRYIDEGWPVIRCQLGGYGGGGFVENALKPRNAWSAAPAFDDEAYLEAIPAMFEYLRNKLGFGPKLTHDVHEHLKPPNRSGTGQAAGTLPAVFSRRRVGTRANRLVPAHAPAMHHAAGHGRVIRQCPRIPAADQRAPHRLHPHPSGQRRRHHPLPQNRRALRVLRRADSLAGGRGQRPGQPSRGHAPRYVELQLRDPRGKRFSARRIGGVPPDTRPWKEDTCIPTTSRG